MTEEVINGVSNDSSGNAVISQINDDDPINLRNGSSSYYIAQTFDGGGYTITAIEIKLLKTGSPKGYVWVELWNTDGTYPTTLISGAISTKIKATDISGTATQYKFYLPKGISLSNGTRYAVVVNCNYPIDASNYITVRANSPAGLTPGQAYTGTSVLVWTGVGNDDLWIKMYQGTLIPIVLTQVNQAPVNAKLPVKGWINFNGTGTITFPGSARDFYNVSGLTDNGTGDYTISWDIDFANDDYAVVATCTGDTMDCDLYSEAGQTTGSVRVRTWYVGSLYDIQVICVIAIGEQ